MFIIGAWTAKLTRRIVGRTGDRTRRYCLKFRILPPHTSTPIREHKRSIHATQYRSPMQQAPKANRHKNRSQHAHAPFSPSLHLLSLPRRFLSFNFSRMWCVHRRTRSWCTGKPSTFSGVCRSFRNCLKRRAGFRRTRVTAGECSPNSISAWSLCHSQLLDLLRLA